MSETAEYRQSPFLQPLSPLALQVKRVTGSVVGRPIELAAIEQGLSEAKAGSVTAVTLEGEPGIGKTRLLMAGSEMASAAGFATIAVAADEEIRGPFLLARSVVAAAGADSAGMSEGIKSAIQRSLDALEGRDQPGLETLPSDQRLLRNLDLAAVAISQFATAKPLALLIDDVQWADDDSLRLLRYVVRSSGGNAIFLLLAIRPEEMAFVNEAVNFIADMERVGMVRRLRIGRFTQVETVKLLSQILGGKIDPAGGAAMHAQAEGVPFVVEELARAYRDAGMIQEIDGVWSLARNAGRLLPSSVKTLISRRAARVSDRTKSLLGVAAVLGRHYSLQDLQALQVHLGEPELTTEAVDEAMTEAVGAGLLIAHGEESAADYSFTHEQVREFAASGLTPTRRRAIHAAMVDLLVSGEPAPEILSLLAYHAKASGNASVCMRFSLQAIENALSASAPEEVMRIVDLALPGASTPQDRVKLLEARDQALDILRKPDERLEGLAELTALADALGDAELESRVQLRRAAAFRLSEEWEQAETLATQVRQAGAREDNPAGEMAACVELGQAVMRTGLGEAYTVPLDVDLDRATETFQRAVVLAEEIGDEAVLAAATRELGVLDLSRVRAWFVDQIRLGNHLELMRAVASGHSLPEMLKTAEIAPVMSAAKQSFERALELFERLGDRRGAMATIIAMAFANWAPDIHMGSSAGQHIEEIRRLSSRMHLITRESDRAMAEAQMLYGAHVFARAKGIPDLAIIKGQETYRHARTMGDRSLEFLAAGRTGLAYLDVGDIEEATAWVDKAAAVASENPTPFRARQLEIWRGLVQGAAGNPDLMRTHFERAIQLAANEGLTAARCEALALLALGAARLGASNKDSGLLDLADRSAREVKELSPLLPGRPPWGWQADAALSRVMLARGEVEAAVVAARDAAGALKASEQEDLHLEILIPVAEALQAGGLEEEQHFIQSQLQMSLAMIGQRVLDEDIRVRWFKGPLGRDLVRLAGSLQGLLLEPAQAEGSVGEGDVPILAMLVEGLTNQEMADRLGVEEAQIVRRLGEMFARIGASSRAEATAFAFREQVV